MIAEPVGDCLDEAGTFAVSGCGNGLFSRGAHRHYVTPIYLLADESGGDRFLRQRFGAGLQAQRHRYGPVIVGGDEHDGQFVYAGKIHRLVNITLGGGAIAEHAYGNPRLPAQLEGIGNASGMRRL